MANLYVGMMKDYLKGYYKKQNDFNKQIEENNKRFTTEYAQSENAKIREQQKRAYSEAKAKIADIYNTVRGLLANANFVNVESLTADRLLFSDESGFNLSVEEVQAFVERYSKNFTMLRLISDWIEKHDTPTEEHPIGKYASVNIVLPEQMLQAYKKFAESALAVIEKIYNNSTIMQNPIEIEAFAEERFAADLFAVVGSGMELSDYKSRRVPETAQHAFDNIVLSGVE